MGLARSTYYDEIKGQPIEEGRLMAHITELCAEFPRYGYRRITAQLREDGVIVNHKKIMRFMKEHGLTVQPRRRYVDLPVRDCRVWSRRLPIHRDVLRASVIDYRGHADY